MKFYIAVAYNEPTHLVEIARSAEEAGFGGIVVSDHVVYPQNLETPYPYTRSGRPRWEADTPWPDPFVAVGAMAAVTWWRPLAHPRPLPENRDIDLTASTSIRWVGGGVVLATAVLYAIFW